MMMAILTGEVGSYLTEVLICIALMTNDLEHLVMCLLALCVSSV